jgi:hypothetical protein
MFEIIETRRGMTSRKSYINTKYIEAITYCEGQPDMITIHISSNKIFKCDKSLQQDLLERCDGK